MATVKLIVSPAYIKDSTVITENVDEKYIRGNIQTAQDLYIEPSLGTLLFNDIVDKVNAGTITGNDDTLYSKYIKPAMKYYVMSLCAPEMLYKFQNKSIATKSSDNAQPISENEMRNTVAYYKGLADDYRIKMVKWLCANSDLFSLYDDTQADGTVNPQSKSYSSPIFLGNTSNDCCE